jgi:DNA-binding CsgD family transcriptional regulator
MLSMQQRSAILELHAKGISKKQIARTLKISLKSVKKVLRSQSSKPPAVIRAEKAEPYRQQILELMVGCKGNLVRVHEEIEAAGADLSYAALTAFRRRHGIG